MFEFDLMLGWSSYIR